MVSVFNSSPYIEIRVCSEVGGGRGVFAKTDVKPGTVLLRELPIAVPAEDKSERETLHMAVARSVLAGPEHEREERLQKMMALHPTSLAEVSGEVLDRVKSEHAEDIQTLKVWLASQVPAESVHLPASGQTVDSSTAATLSDDDLLRVLLAVRFNAHYSGLYIASEMFNHQCNPNCIKLVTSAGSEVRAVRAIGAGEEACISYLSPPLQSAARRAALLQAQHFFVPASIVSGTTGSYPAEMEALSEAAASRPSSEVQAEIGLVEDELDGCEARMQSALAELRSAQYCDKRGKGSNPAGCGGDDASVPTEGVALLDVFADLCKLQRQLSLLVGPRHVVLARVYDMISIAASELVSALARMPSPSLLGKGSQASSGQDGQACSAESPPKLQQGIQAWGRCVDASLAITASPATASKPPGASAAGTVVPANAAIQTQHPDAATTVAMSLLRAATELHATQALFAGPEHYDVCRTLLDMQQALEWLLSNAPKALYASFPQFGSFSKASRAEHMLLKQHKQIRAFYS